MMDGQEVAVYSLTWGSAGCLAFVAYPTVSHYWQQVARHIEQYQEARVIKATKVLDDMFLNERPTWLTMTYRIGPLLGGGLMFLLSSNLLLAVLGAVVGVLVPDLWVKYSRAKRKRQFQGQLVDALFMLSSSLRAGLSLMQAFEVLETEMPPPASQEFGLMIKAHRVGRPLEEALQGLNQRMACEELNLVTTAILVARGTGGDVTRIITQLISTIREKSKLSEKVATLTMQGKLQAYLMSVLPIFFVLSVRSINPNYFDVFFNDPLGRSLIVVIVVLWLMGMFLMLKLSKVEI